MRCAASLSTYFQLWTPLYDRNTVEEIDIENILCVQGSCVFGAVGFD